VFNSFCQAIASLSSLTSLELMSDEQQGPQPTPLAAAIGQLWQLKCLDVALVPAGVRLLPPSVSWL
jgi:hypothetical protein